MEVLNGKVHELAAMDWGSVFVTHVSGVSISKKYGLDVA
jgi:hypothetical protein